MTRVMLSLVFALILIGCQEEEAAAPPAPVKLTMEAAGHYCQMTVMDHPGPKAQVHLAGNPHPLWFTQVRDAIAYQRLPEKTADVIVIYVNDMGASESWEKPGTGNWIDARKAIFVHGSDRRGGMGAPEIVPFADKAAAARFVKAHGGMIVPFAEVSDQMVLGPVDVDPEAVETKPVHHGQHKGAEG